jgi:hypothetical protein
MHIAKRVANLDWNAVETSLWQRGYALIPIFLSREECNGFIRLYPDKERFRSHIIMARYRFGSGDYKYFKYPLPYLIQALREQFYAHLALIANRWNEALNINERYPEKHDRLLALCHRHRQRRPTPLLLHYEKGDYNCLHQDLYGTVVFPLQLVCFLSQPEEDYTGGEFVLAEQRPRAQPKVEVMNPNRGELMVFATHGRPVKGARGFYRVTMRHGISLVRSGSRYALGIPFHDAQ